VVGFIVSRITTSPPHHPTTVLEGLLVSANQSQGGVDSQQKTTGNGLGGGVYVDPTASAKAETLIAGNQAFKDNNDVWGTITLVP